jgi:hypothetical protein
MIEWRTWQFALFGPPFRLCLWAGRVVRHAYLSGYVN